MIIVITENTTQAVEIRKMVGAATAIDHMEVTFLDVNTTIDADGIIRHAPVETERATPPI